MTFKEKNRRLYEKYKPIYRSSRCIQLWARQELQASESEMAVALKNGDKLKLCTVHRLIALTFIENPLSLPEIDHIDGVKFNNFVGNLRWATRSENEKAAYDLGLAKAGEEHGRAKLIAEQVIYIRENPDDLNTHELAEKLNVDHTLIGMIQRGKIWQNLASRPQF